MTQHAEHPARRAGPFPSIRTAAKVAPGERREHAERTQWPRPASLLLNLPGRGKRGGALGPVRAAPSEIDQSPAPARRLDRVTGQAEQPGRVAEQSAAPRRRIGVERLVAERPLGEQLLPAVGHRGKLGGRQSVGGDPLQDGLRRRRRAIQRLERLAPPGEADPGHLPLAAAGEDRAQSDVKTPERLERGARAGGRVGKGEAAVGVELAGQRYSTFFAAATTSSTLIRASFSRLAA